MCQQSANRRRHDDPAVLPVDHVPPGSPRQFECRTQVYSQHAVPLLGGEIEWLNMGEIFFGIITREVVPVAPSRTGKSPGVVGFRESPG